MLGDPLTNPRTEGRIVLAAPKGICQCDLLQLVRHEPTFWHRSASQSVHSPGAVREIDQVVPRSVITWTSCALSLFAFGWELAVVGVFLIALTQNE